MDRMYHSVVAPCNANGGHHIKNSIVRNRRRLPGKTWPRLSLTLMAVTGAWPQPSLTPTAVTVSLASALFDADGSYREPGLGSL